MSFASPTRYSPNSFFSMANLLISDNSDMQQCSREVAGPIVATPRKNRHQVAKLSKNHGESPSTLRGGNKVASPNNEAPKKRQNNRQLNGSGKQFGEACAMATAFCATPTRPMRREHSACAIMIPKRGTKLPAGLAPLARFTPPSTFLHEDRGVAPIFAGSKFTESPSAKSLPLPPMQWLKERKIRKDEAVNEEESEEEVNAMEKSVKRMEQLGITSDCAGGHHTSSSESNSENFISGNWSPPNAGQKTPTGVRMHPLHLIAATVMTN